MPGLLKRERRTGDGQRSDERTLLFRNPVFRNDGGLNDESLVLDVHRRGGRHFRLMFPGQGAPLQHQPIQHCERRRGTLQLVSEHF